MTYKSGGEAKQSIENTYGEAIRRKLKGDKVNKNQLRNLFSSLGTAESSSFIENMSNMESESGRDIFQAEMEKAGKISNVNDLMSTAESEYNGERERIIKERDAKLIEIKENLALTEEEKALAIQQNNLEALANLSNLQQQKSDYLYNNSNNFYNYRNGIAQNLIPGLMQLNLLAGQQGNSNYTPYENSSLVGLQSMADGTVRYSDGTIRDKYGNIVGYA